MLLKMGNRICDCLERAGVARQRAQAAADERQSQEYLKLESSWLQLAQSYEFAERLEAFLQEGSRWKHSRFQKTSSAAPGQWQNAAQQNWILGGLPPKALALLQPRLEPVTLAAGMVLQKQGTPVVYCFFPLTAAVSVVAGRRDCRLDVGIVGREGVTGLPALLGTDTSPFEDFVQVSGLALRIPASELRGAFAADATIRTQLHSYTRHFLLKLAENAVANGTCTIDQRLARCLLDFRESLGRDDIAVGHEALALMLSVRRASITVAMQTFIRANVIANPRRRIVILDREKLERIALEGARVG